MFTGIVTAVGSVKQLEPNGDKLGLTIQAPYDDLTIGESVAVAGACLTVVNVGSGWFKVEVVDATKGRTRFAEMAYGEKLNLERAMTPADRFGGHIVSGHVDGIGEVAAMNGKAGTLRVRLPAQVAELTVPLGSIAVDGVSLTVSALPEPDVAEIALIPHTKKHTTLGSLMRGDKVHLESDVIGKYVKLLMEKGQGGQ